MKKKELSPLDKCFEKIGKLAILEHCIKGCSLSSVDEWIVITPKDEPYAEAMLKIIARYSNVRMYQPTYKGQDLLTAYITRLTLWGLTLKR